LFFYSSKVFYLAIKEKSRAVDCGPEKKICLVYVPEKSIENKHTETSRTSIITSYTKFAAVILLLLLKSIKEIIKNTRYRKSIQKSDRTHRRFLSTFIIYAHLLRNICRNYKFSLNLMCEWRNFIDLDFISSLFLKSVFVLFVLHLRQLKKEVVS
jgi:hypothetical protein